MTELPLVTFGGLGGPAVRFALCHNSAAASSSQSIPSPGGFSLGPGWSISFGGALVDNGNGTVDLIEDDGNWWSFTLTAGVYSPESGNHDHLIWDAATQRWILTRPSQWQRVFDAGGRLLAVRDAAGGAIAITRDAPANHRITAITSDPNGLAESLTFFYDPATGRLDHITSPAGQTWTFGYDASARVNLLTFPAPAGGGAAAVIGLTFGTNHRILTLSDAAGVYGPAGMYTYQYAAAGRLSQLTDPAPAGGGAAATQVFLYPTQQVGSPARWETQYTDRDGVLWKYRFDQYGQFRERIAASGEVFAVTYDSSRNYNGIALATGETISLTWGPAATLQTVEFYNETSQRVHDVGQVWSRPDPAGRPNFWRLEQQYNAEGDLVRYFYVSSSLIAPSHMLDSGVGEDPNQLQPGDLSVAPTTGVAGGVRQYWLHAEDGGLWPYSRAYLEMEAGGSISGFPQQQQPQPYSWRWRLFWIVPIVGAHLGVDYVDGNGEGERYVDYGQPPDNRSACACCGPGRHTNNRYWFGTGAANDAIRAKSWRRGRWESGSQAMRNCFERNLSSGNLPRQWGACCQYDWLGRGPGGNSNSGIRAVLSLCAGDGFALPPLCWRLAGVGWATTGMPTNDDSCPGYGADR